MSQPVIRDLRCVELELGEYGESKLVFETLASWQGLSFFFFFRIIILRY